MQVEADTCSGCGEPLSESTAPAAEGGYDADRPIRCHACTELNRMRDKYPEGHGLYFGVRRTWTNDSDEDWGWRRG